jgi:hypothetical protein
MLGPALEQEQMKDLRDKFSIGVRGGGKRAVDGADEAAGERLVDGWRALVDELDKKVLVSSSFVGFRTSARTDRLPSDQAHIASLPPFPPDSLVSEYSSPYPIPKTFPLDPSTGLRVIPFWLSQPHVRPLDLQPDVPLDPSLPTPTGQSNFVPPTPRPGL